MTKNLWKKDNTNCLSIKWEDSIDLKSSILWRGIIFHVRLKGNTLEFGRGRSIVFIYDNKEYKCDYWRWKQFGGCTDHMKPIIKTLHNELKITMDLKSLSFEDVQLDDSQPTQPQGELFEISEPPPDIFVELPVNNVPEKKSANIRIEKNEVTLYEYKDSKVKINSLAYFEKDELVVDFWKLSNNHEDEYFLIIQKDQLEKLFNYFLIPNENRAELLIGILNGFKGEDSFERFEEFLKIKNILFKSRGGHDSR